MNLGATDVGTPQDAVDKFFARDAPNWESVYRKPDLFSVIHQYRHRKALEWVDRLNLKAGATVLEVGCGAGLFAVAMAKRGFDVVATDSTSTMLKLTERNAKDAEVRLTVKQVDVHRMAEPSECYDLTIALGVVPWLHSAEAGMAELVRVLRPGGYLLVNADNRYRLQRWLDPMFTPPLAPARHVIARLVRGRRTRPDSVVPGTVMHSIVEFDELVARVGLGKIYGQAFGFGPFTMFGRRIFAERAAVRVHLSLQRGAESGAAILRWTGSQYMVLARKLDGQGE